MADDGGRRRTGTENEGAARRLRGGAASDRASERLSRAHGLAAWKAVLARG